MSALWVVLLVLAGVILLITLIMFIRAKIVIEYNGSLSVYLNVLFFKKQLYPKILSDIDVDDYSLKKLRKKQEKAIKKAKKKADKDSKKKVKKEDKHAQNTKKKSSFSDIVELIKTVKQIVTTLISSFFGYLRVDVAKINLVVASEDAAKTAITYGVVNQAVSYLLAILDKITNVKYNKKTEVSVNVDFLAEKFSADIKIAFSIRVGQAIKVAIKTVYNYLKTKNTVG